MRERRSWETKITSERIWIQKEIREKFGEEAILEAKRRLCEDCKLSCGVLLPITTKGEDCPYFQRKENKR